METALKLQKVSPQGVHSQTTMEIDRELGTGDPVMSFAERRAREIGDYLHHHPHVMNWVALDDIDLAMADGQPASKNRAKMRRNFVRTDDKRCLTMNDAGKAIEILEMASHDIDSDGEDNK